MSLSVVGAAAERPDAIALVTRDGTLDFATLARHVAGAIASLRASGVDPARPAELVALTPTLSQPSIVAILACIELGVPFVAIHPRAPDAERRRLLARVAEALVVPTDVAFEASDVAPAVQAIDPERPLAVLFTSGSSGDPKPVVLSRRAFVASADASSFALPLGPRDRWLLALPPAHVGGLSVVTRCLLARAAIILGGDGPFDPAATRALFDEGVTIASVVPTTLRRLLADDPSHCPPSSLRAVLVGGAAAPRALLEEARTRGYPVRATYGLTEACSQVATWRSADEPPGALPLPGFELRIIGNDGSAVPEGEEGEILVRSRALLSGTWPLENSRDPLDAEGYFHTGDLGRLDADGRLHVLARRTDLVVSGGENVYPAEVEARLLECAGVSAACVVGIADADLGERVGAALVLAPGASLDDVRARLRSELSGFKLPRTFTVVDSLPLLASGKVDRRAVRALFSATESREA